MPLQETSGAASYDAFGGGVPVIPNYIEEVFSTWLYTGNGSTQTITNGIDLSGKGGLVWIKDRVSTNGHLLYDTLRGALNFIQSNSTAAQGSLANSLTAFNSNGFNVGSVSNVNFSGNTFVSWTFREQPKFFDVVTYTGDGNSPRNIAHNLGAVPGFIIIKRTDSAGSWFTYARNASNTYELLILNATSASAGTVSAASLATSTTFDPTAAGAGWAVSQTNIDTATYIVYLFAHNAGGFGLTGTDNVISCGSYTTNGSGVITSPVNLGYEPQWILSKRIDAAGNWRMLDVMRGDGSADNNISNQYYLYSNLSDAETGPTYGEPAPTATGFTVTASTASSTYIYIAIRRGPMKTPTTGTSVFSPNAFNAVTNTYQTTNFPIDWQITADRTGAADKRNYSRLTGVATPGTTAARYMSTNTTDTEAATSGLTVGWDNTGFRVPSSYASTPFVAWNFRRAPGFFDQVCYTGTGSATTFNHNLGVVPEMMIVKSRSGAYNWAVYCAYLGGTNPANRYVILNSPNGLGGTAVYWNDTAPTATVFTVGTTNATNASGSTYIAYLFASVPGVSKVGSYTGTGATLTIDCGFTGGARFVVIKRTDSSGTWWVWDTSRGMVAGTDPRLLLNDTNPETNNNWVYTTSGGFQIVTTDATVNASGGSYIFLAIA